MLFARFDDVLEKSLPNLKHPGRVRAMGGLVPMKTTFGKSAIRRRRNYSKSEEEFDARVDQRVEERVRGIEERLRQEMKSELAILLQQTIGQQERTYSPTVVQSNCQLVKPYPDLSRFTEESELSCKLQAIVGENTLVVAVGTIHVPVVQGRTIHNRPMPPDYARVTVDAIQDAAFIDLPLPFPNGEQLTLGTVLGSFTSWSMSMILTSSDEEPRKELQVPGGRNATSHIKAFDDINFDKLGRTFKHLHDRFLELDGSPFQIDPPLDLFCSADSICVYADDHAALLTPREWLIAPVIQIWML